MGGAMCYHSKCAMSMTTDCDRVPVPALLRRASRASRALLAAALGSLGLALAGCGGSPTPPAGQAAPRATAVGDTSRHGVNGIAAVVGGEGIPLWEYNALLTINEGGTGKASGTALARARVRTIDQIVDEALLNRYAETHGWAVSGVTVGARLQAYQVQSGAGFARSLAHLGVDQTQFERMIARNLNAQAVTAHVISGIAAPPAQVQVLQVVVASLADARRMRASLLRGADAALLSVRASTDPRVRHRAGQIPPLTRAQGDSYFGPHWSPVAFTLQPGQISQPVRLSDGWGIIEVVQRRPPQALVQQTFGRFVARLRQAVKIEVYV